MPVTYALDTNTVSYYMGEEGRVVSRLQALAPSRISLPSLVVYELSFGLRRVGRQAALQKFGRFVQSIEVLDFDLEAADHAARIRIELEAVGTPIGSTDLLIAATARRHGCTLVTRKLREFSRVSGLATENWY